MAYDSPRLGGYTLKNPPMPMTIQWEAVQQLNELADGGLKQRILGYRISAKLKWDDGWIRDEDLSGLIGVANDASASIAFVPRPQSKPTISYAVIWKNKFEFNFHEGHFGHYEGTIELQSPTVTSVVGALP